MYLLQLVQFRKRMIISRIGLSCIEDLCLREALLHIRHYIVATFRNNLYKQKQFFYRNKMRRYANDLITNLEIFTNKFDVKTNFYIFNGKKFVQLLQDRIENFKAFCWMILYPIPRNLIHSHPKAVYLNCCSSQSRKHKFQDFLSFELLQKISYGEEKTIKPLQAWQKNEYLNIFLTNTFLLHHYL